MVPPQLVLTCRYACHMPGMEAASFCGFAEHWGHMHTYSSPAQKAQSGCPSFEHTSYLHVQSYCSPLSMCMFLSPHTARIRPCLLPLCVHLYVRPFHLHRSHTVHTYAESPVRLPPLCDLRQLLHPPPLPWCAWGPHPTTALHRPECRGPTQLKTLQENVTLWRRGAQDILQCGGSSGQTASQDQAHHA